MQPGKFIDLVSRRLCLTRGMIIIYEVIYDNFIEQQCTQLACQYINCYCKALAIKAI